MRNNLFRLRSASRQIGPDLSGCGRRNYCYDYDVSPVPREAPVAMLHLLVPALRALISGLRSRRELGLENLALRQQLATLRRQGVRPKP